MGDPDEIVRRLERVRSRIAAAGGDADRVRVITVTKGHPLEVARAAARAGCRDLGENYTAELAAKAHALHGEFPDLRWHMIGTLQRRRVRQAGAWVHTWHGIDRPEVCDEVARRRPGSRVLVQVNVTEEPAKGGCAPGDAAALVERCRGAGLEVLGLMAVGPTGAPPAAASLPFRRLAALADELELVERCMGMSADLEVAVAAGATMVRVGTDVVGERPPRGDIA